jgi:hypothetical protein
MKPRPYVQIQAVMTALTVVALLAVLGREAALPAAIFETLGLAIWLFFFLRYVSLVRGVGDRRSGNRRDKDRVMFNCLLVGLVGPATLAWIDYSVADYSLIKPPLDDGEAAVAAVALLAIPLAILVSSSVDWYLIRPFREGVYGEPACRARAHRDGDRMDYARYWILHRMVSEFTVYAGIVVLVGLFFAISSTIVDSEEGRSAVGFIGVLGIAVWSLSELSGLRAALKFVRYPRCELGSWVAGRTADCVDIEGFVLDVSVSPGVQLICEPRGCGAADIADEHRSVPLRQAQHIETVPPPRDLCAGHCEFWFAECEVGLREREGSRTPSEL